MRPLTFSWDEMEWRLHGAAEIEHMEAEEVCTIPSLNYYAAPLTMRSCMHLCENLGGSRLPGMNSLQQVEVVSSLLREKGISPYRVWAPFHDEENEGE